MPTVVFSDTIRHEERCEHTDYLCLRNAAGDDDSEGVHLKKFILYPKGVKLGQSGTSASATDDGPVSFSFFARRPVCTSSAVKVLTLQLDEDEKNPRETIIDLSYPSDTLVLRGVYQSLSFKIEAVTEGREVQFEHVRGDEQPILELIEELPEEKAGDEEKEDEPMEEDVTQEYEGEAREEIGDEEEVVEETEGMEETEEGEVEQVSDDEKEKETEVKEEEEEVKETEEEEGEKTAEDVLSISSADLEVEDAIEMSEEEKKALEERRRVERAAKRAQEDKEAMELEDDWTVDKFTPVKITCRRPPWKERAQFADAKAWELFCDAVTTFDSATLDEYIDDWVVTVENLLPSLRGCLRDASTKAVPTFEGELPLLLADWARFGLCLDRADRQPSPAKFLRVGLGVVEQVAGYSYESKYAVSFLEQGIVWDLLNVITETTYSALQVDAMQALHTLQCCRGTSLAAAEAFFRFEKAVGNVAEGEEMDKSKDGEEDADVTSIYDSIVLLVAQTDETGETTALLDLAIRVLSRANLNGSAAKLVGVCRRLASAEEEQEGETAIALDQFVERFEENQKVLHSFGLHEDALRAYSVIADVDWTGILCVLLSHRHSASITKALTFTLNIVDGEECVGLFALSESSPVLQKLLLKQLKLCTVRPSKKEEEGEVKMEEGEGDDKAEVLFGGEKVEDRKWTFNETPSLSEKMDGHSLASLIGHRLTVLDLVDKLAEINRSLSLDTLDAVERIDILHALLRLTVTREGDAALAFVFSECAFSQLAAITLLCCEEKRHANTIRASASYAYAVELMKNVSKRATNGKFWLRNARHYQRMLKYATLSAASCIHQWWEPFSEAAIAIAEAGSHSTVTAIRNRLKSMMEKYKDGEPPFGAISLLRTLKHLIQPRTATTRLHRAHRLETVGFCLMDDVNGIVEIILKTALEYRTSLWQLSTSIEGSDASIFCEFTHIAFEVLQILYETALREKRTAKSVSVRAVGLAVGVWALTTGVTRASTEMGEESRRLRRRILSFMSTMMGERMGKEERVQKIEKKEEGEVDEERDWDMQTPTMRVVRRIADYARDRFVVQPGALTLLCLLAPGGRQEKNDEKDDERVEKRRLAYAEGIRNSAKPIAEMLLNTAPYARQTAWSVLSRMETTMDDETFTVIVRAMYNHFIYWMTTRPKLTGTKEKKNGVEMAVVDMEDVPVKSARDRPRRIIEVLLSLLDFPRFRLTLLHLLHNEPQANAHLTRILAVYESPTKHNGHVRFQELCSLFLSSLADHSLYTERKEEEKMEGDENGEVEKPNEDEFLAEEDDDDRDCVVLDEEVDELPSEVEESAEEKEKKLDIPLRIARAFVRLACSPLAASDSVIAALRALDTVVASGGDVALTTARRAWLDQPRPTAKILLRRVAREAKGGDREDSGRASAETLRAEVASHLTTLFAADDQARHLFDLIELDTVDGKDEEEAKKAFEGEETKEEDETVEVDTKLHPIVLLLKLLKDGQWKSETVGEVTRQVQYLLNVAESGREEKSVVLPPRPHIVLHENLIQSTLSSLSASSLKDVQPFRLRVSLSRVDYREIGTDSLVRGEIAKRGKKGRKDEDRLRIAERNAGVNVKRPELASEKEARLAEEKKKAEEKKAKEETEKKETKTEGAAKSATKSKSKEPVTPTPSTPRIKKPVKKPAVEKKNENIPNRIQPAVVPSRPAKRTAPTSVPKAGIKRRR